jgi:hypothetical protein
MGNLVAVPTGEISKVIDLANSVGTVSEVLDIASAVRRAARNLQVALPDTPDMLGTVASQTPVIGFFVSNYYRAQHLFDPKSYQRDEGVRQLEQSIEALDTVVEQFKKDNAGGTAPTNREPIVTAIGNVESTIQVLDTFYPQSAKWDEAKANFYDEVDRFSHPLQNIKDGLRDLAPSLNLDWTRIRRWALIIAGLTVGGIVLLMVLNKKVLG